MIEGPAITVLMPVYNAELYLKDAIESVLEQEFTDFEFIIINDGSTDSSEEIIKSYADPRIKYYKNEINLKLITTLNKGFDLATGKYIARMDADDFSMPHRLQLQFEFMERNPEVGLCGTGFESLTDEIISGVALYAPDHETICFTHLYQIHLIHGTCMFRTAVLRAHSLYFNPDFSHAEDYELWSRISMVTKLANIQHVLYKIRFHPQKVSKRYFDVQTTNSTRVKKNLFKQMGITVNDEELTLLQSIAHHTYGQNMLFAESVQILLEKMLLAKNHSMFFSQSFYRNKLTGFWLNVNYNLTRYAGFRVYKYYWKSPLSSDPTTPISVKIKFLIKALLKI